MKTFAHFDASGVVRGIVTVDGPETVRAGLQAGPDQSIVEVESAELSRARGNVEKVRQILKEHKLVQPPPQRIKITKA